MHHLLAAYAEQTMRKIGDAQYIDAVIRMYNLIEYSDNYSKTSGILFQYCRGVQVLDNDGEVIYFTEANFTDL